MAENITGWLMIDEEHYIDLPEDPELAFLKLERLYKKNLNSDIAFNDNSSSYKEARMNYIVSIITAAKTLDLIRFAYLRTQDMQEIEGDWNAFSLYVRGYTNEIQIRHSRRAKAYSVPLDDTTKEKIRHHLGQMKTLCDKLDFSVEKKEVVFKKILDLELEMTRERTRFEIYAGLSLKIASVAGEIGKKADPLRKLIDSIANLLGKAKDKEPQQSLPAPKEMKRIEAPKRSSSLDDDVPF